MDRLFPFGGRVGDEDISSGSLQDQRLGDLAHLEHIAGEDRFDEGIGDNGFISKDFNRCKLFYSMVE
jgi:hypothetical protein